MVRKGSFAMRLNHRAANLCQQMIADAEALRIAVRRCPSGAGIIDCGIDVPGGLEAGRRMAEVCMAGLGTVALVPGNGAGSPGPLIAVHTDQPLAACMRSQYAGWQIARDKYFAMASGPMRSLAGREPLFQSIGRGSAEEVAVGVLETAKLPPPEVCDEIARVCGTEPAHLFLLVAPTASHAGTFQVVARSVETAMHKLFELGFDLNLVESGFGAAPLPPVGRNDLAAMGRTNDAILYGAEVTLWVRGDEREIETLGPQIPSDSSPDHGRPFAEIFARYDRDFYKIDPKLFAPAVVNLCHLPSGRAFRFGRLLPEVLSRSFGFA